MTKILTAIVLVLFGLMLCVLAEEYGLIYIRSDVWATHETQAKDAIGDYLGVTNGTDTIPSPVPYYSNTVDHTHHYIANPTTTQLSAGTGTFGTNEAAALQASINGGTGVVVQITSNPKATLATDNLERVIP